MLSEDSGERRQLRAQSVLGGAQQQPEAEQLPCPRCDSTNTKFCYYNNYNLSQPRHFCKACRRYWTRGGTLRNVPVGGGSRKNSKRSRASSSTTVAAAAASTASVHDPAPGTPTSASLPLKPTEMGMVPMDSSDMNLSGNAGSFTSLLSSQASSGFLALGGFGLGVGPGFEEMGLGSGRAGGFWPYQEVGDAVTIGSHGGGGGVATGAAPGGCNPWQFSGSDSGYADGDCFAWPDLAISMSGKGLK